MGLFEHFPYVNFHNLNLDWILKKIKELLTRMAAAEEKLEEHEERLDAAETMLEDHESRLDAAEAAITGLNTRVTAAEADIDDLQTRMTAAEADVDDLQDRMTTAEASIAQLEDAVTAEEITTSFISGCTSNNAEFYPASQIYKAGNRIYGHLDFAFLADGTETMIKMPASLQPLVGYVANISLHLSIPTGSGTPVTYIAGSLLDPSSGFYVPAVTVNEDEVFTMILDYVVL